MLLLSGTFTEHSQTQPCSVIQISKFKKDTFKDLKSIYRKSTMTETITENLEQLKIEKKQVKDKLKIFSLY